MQTASLGNFQVIEIRKPMRVDKDYDIVRVDVRQFERARKNGRFVLVRTPNGERVFMPKHKGLKLVKEVFLFPDNPMCLYEIVIPHCEKKDNEYYQFHGAFA